jgi:hypothetical protein
MRNIIRNLSLCYLVAQGISGFAQMDKLERATQLLQSRNADAARLAIDSVVLHPETKADFTAWTTRAYIYFEIYKKTEKQKLFSPLRDTIVSSIQVSNNLKPDADYLNNNNKLLIGLSTNYFNLAKTLLQDSVNEKRSTYAYTRCKQLYLLAKPDTNFTSRDIEYYGAVGSVYSDIFNNDNNNTPAHETAKIALMKVLDLQPENTAANMNFGLMYLNQGINLAKSLDYGADFTQIDAIQENIVKLAKQAEGFIIKVYKKDNKNSKSVQALYYIYRMLNDVAKQSEFEKKCKELNVLLD